MIKFFQHIRHNLLSDGKTGKYLKYAIGEIVLVVIGILIALQLNNWNANRNLKNEELKIIKSLHQEFSQNLEKFNAIYENHLIRRKSIELVMAPDIEKIPLDSLQRLMKNIGNNYTFDPYQGIYNAIINSGKIELISNDSLKQRISKFQDLLSDYKEEETNTMNFVQTNLYPFIIDHRKLNFNTFHGILESTKEHNSTLKQDLLDMIATDRYENLLVFVYGYMRGTFIEGPILQEEMQSIIALLESEMQK